MTEINRPRTPTARFLYPPSPFIVGTGRCGTTFLKTRLESHPDLAIPPETHFVPAVLRKCRDRHYAEECVLGTLSDHPGWKKFGLNPRTLLVEGDFQVSIGLRRFYELYMMKQGKSRWGDKTPAYHAHMAIIEEAFPESRFIHVIRDGRDVALSVRKMLTAADARPIERQSLEYALQWWVNRLNRAREEGQRVRHYMEVRYEDLILDTETALRAICDFIELPWTQELVGCGFENSNERPDPTRLGRWRGTMTDAELQSVDTIASSLLRQLGYEYE